MGWWYDDTPDGSMPAGARSRLHPAVDVSVWHFVQSVEHIALVQVAQHRQLRHGQTVAVLRAAQILPDAQCSTLCHTRTDCARLNTKLVLSRAFLAASQSRTNALRDLPLGFGLFSPWPNE